MFSYIIAMQFLSWALAILMLIGLGLFKFWEYSAKNSNNDAISKGLEVMIEEYYSSNFSGKVLKLLFFGCFFFSTLIGVIRGDFKDE